jgi:hypothetical protein
MSIALSCVGFSDQRLMGDVKDGGKTKTKWGRTLDGGSGG